MILLKLKWSTRGISGVKNFSLLLLAKTRRNPKILASSQMDEMAPENVTTTGTLKLDARRGAQQAQFKAWSKYFNLKEVPHEKSSHFNWQKNSTSIYSKKQRCLLFFSFKSKLSWFRAGLFNNCLVSWMMFSLQKGY